MTDLVRAARGYIERLDFRLVVQNAEKVPIDPVKANWATQDIDRLARTLRAHPDGILAARVGAHCVLDVDVRHDGPAQLARLLARYGALPPTWEAETPTDGRHFWFQPAGFKTRGKLANGIEALFGNRLVTLPPSSRSGGVYRWRQHPLSVPIAPLPEWLLGLLRPPKVERTEFTSDVPKEQREKRARAWLDQCEPAISGQHGHGRTFWVAMVVTRGFDLDEETAFQALGNWNANCSPRWNDRELRRKVKQARMYGDMPIGKMLEKKKEAA